MQPRSVAVLCSVTNAPRAPRQARPACARRTAARRLPRATSARRSRVARERRSRRAARSRRSSCRPHCRDPPKRRRQVADDRRLVARHVAGIGVLEDDARRARRARAPRASPRPSARRRRRDRAARRARLQAVGVEPRDVVDDDRVERAPRSPHRGSATDRCWRRAAPAGREAPSRARRRARAPSPPSGIPSPAARSRLGADAARNGSCISSECSRACAAGCSRTIGVAPASARAHVLVDRARCRAASRSRPPDRSTTPSKPTKCDGPTRTATSNGRSRSCR